MFTETTSESNFMYSMIDTRYDKNIISTNTHPIPKDYSPDMTITLESKYKLKGQKRIECLGIGVDLNYVTKIDKTEFILVEPSDQYYGTLSRYAFAFVIPEKSYSITHQLKAYGHINDLSFTFQRQSLEKGMIYYGGVPDDIIQGHHKSSCNVIGRNGYWDCELSHVFIGDISYVYENTFYENKYNGFFATHQKEIEAPSDFYDLLMKELFIDLLQENKCNKMSFGNEHIECSCVAIEHLKPIIFVFDGTAYKFQGKELFRKFETLCSFMIVKNQDNNSWIFGNFFINHYITTFDYDLKKMVFYSNDTFEIVNFNSLFPGKKIIVIITTIVSIIAFVIIIRIVISKLKSRKVTRMNKAIEDVYQKL